MGKINKSIKGIPKSGKYWKQGKLGPQHLQNQENKGTSTTWEAKMRQKKEKIKLQKKIAELRGKSEAKKKKLGKIIRERREKKKLNEFKAS